MAKNPYNVLSALVLWRPPHPLAELGAAARSLVLRATEAHPSHLAAADALGISERTLYRVEAALNPAKSTDRSGRMVTVSYPLGTIDKTARSGRRPRVRHDPTVMPVSGRNGKKQRKSA